MFHLIYKYLISYKQVNIPGVGHFSFEKQPAKIDAERNLLIAPVSTLQYSRQPDAADKSLHSFLATEMNIGVDGASAKYKDFAEHLKSNLSLYHAAELPSLGTLSMMDGGIAFEPNVPIKEYYPDIDLADALKFLNNDEGKLTDEQIKLGEAAEKEEARIERNNWLLYALVLGLIGAGAIAYYYLQIDN